FSVDVATRSEIDRLHKERQDRLTKLTTFTAMRDAGIANLELNREDLAEIASPCDVTGLVAVLAGEAGVIFNRKRDQNIHGELRKLERNVAAQIRKLTPPLPETSLTTIQLPVPRVETVAEFESRYAELDGKLRTASASIEDDESRLRENEKTLAAALS